MDEEVGRVVGGGVDEESGEEVVDEESGEGVLVEEVVGGGG